MVRTDENENRTKLIHVRFEGRSFDIPLNDLDIGTGTPDGGIKSAVAQYMDLPPRSFNGYVVERHEGGNWTIRPEAVFG